MSSISSSGISLSKKNLSNGRITTNVSRTITFYHKATAGNTSISLTSLSMPAELSSQTQITADEISNAHLFLNRKNVTLISLAKGTLVQGIDYVISDSITINLIGTGYTAGADDGEIFIGSVIAVPLSDVTVTSAKSVVRTYTASAGTTTLVLGRNYNVNVNPNDNVGSIKVFKNGALLNRNTANSSTTLDRDYYEIPVVDSNAGTSISFNTPLLATDKITVDFGVNGVSDVDAMGSIESLSGSISRIATAVSAINGVPAGNYINTNPSDIERRAFADYVIDLLKKSVPVGTVRASLLTLAQFQSETSGTWVLANGQNVSGTTYATITGRTTVPDMRSTAMRMKDNGRGLNPDGDLAIGAYQGDTYASHTHIQDPHTHFVTYVATSTSGGTSVPGSGNQGTLTSGATTATNQASGGNETRMKNTTVNFFIKVGY